MGEVQIDHGGLNLLVTQQLLDGVEMSAGFQEMGCETMTQMPSSAFAPKCRVPENAEPEERTGWIGR